MEPKLNLQAPCIATSMDFSTCHKINRTPPDDKTDPVLMMPTSQTVKVFGRQQVGSQTINPFAGINGVKDSLTSATKLAYLRPTGKRYLFLSATCLYSNLPLKAPCSPPY